MSSFKPLVIIAALIGFIAGILFVYFARPPDYVGYKVTIRQIAPHEAIVKSSPCLANSTCNLVMPIVSSRHPAQRVVTLSVTIIGAAAYCQVFYNGQPVNANSAVDFVWIEIDDKGSGHVRLPLYDTVDFSNYWPYIDNSTVEGVFSHWLKLRRADKRQFIFAELEVTFAPWQ